MFPNGVDLYHPPRDLFERSAHYAQYNLDVRAEMLYLHQTIRSRTTL